MSRSRAILWGPPPKNDATNLGWLDVCLRVANAGVSRQFYEGLGFKTVEGAEGWAVVVNGEAQIGLFEARYMSSELSLNFRGGDVPSIGAKLKEEGYRFEEESIGSSGGASALLKGPDGQVIFFDSGPGEAKKT